MHSVETISLRYHYLFALLLFLRSERLLTLLAHIGLNVKNLEHFLLFFEHRLIVL